MTPEQAEILVNECTDGILTLDGLNALDGPTADKLARFQGHLSFPDLETLPDEVAEMLVADRLGDYPIDDEFEIRLPLQRTLFLDGLRHLLPDSATKLARHNDALSLNGIKTLTIEVARGLAGHRGELSLDGLESLQDPDAPPGTPQEWARVLLDGDPGSHTESLAEVFATFQATRVSLNGLKTLSTLEAECLANSEALESGECKFHLLLNGLEALEPGVAECLADFPGELSLEGIRDLSLDDILHFAGRDRQWDVHFGSSFLAEIIDEASRVFRIYARQRPDESDGWRDSEDDAWFVIDRPYRMRIESGPVTPDRARLLGELSQGICRSLSESHVDHWASLELPHLREIENEVATELAKHPGELCLDALESLSDSIAESLSQHDGPLSLNNVTHLTIYQAEMLAKHGHPLSLSGLLRLDYHEAKALVEGRKATLTLHGIHERVSPEVYALLQKNAKIQLQ